MVCATLSMVHVWHCSPGKRYLHLRLCKVGKKCACLDLQQLGWLWREAYGARGIRSMDATGSTGRDLAIPMRPPLFGCQFPTRMFDFSLDHLDGQENISFADWHLISAGKNVSFSQPDLGKWLDIGSFTLPEIALGLLLRT